MGRFERELLPAGLSKAQGKVKVLQREMWFVSNQLDAHETWGNHSCNCEHCESRDWVDLSEVKRLELEADYKAKESELGSLEADIKRMIAYKAFVEKNGLA